MKKKLAVIIAMSLLDASPAFSEQPFYPPVSQTPALQCERGPITRNYGHTDWLVYGCNDKNTLIILPGAGNPASSSYFTFSNGDTGYQLHAEGLEGAQAAHADLKKLTSHDITSLESEIEQMTPPKLPQLAAQPQAMAQPQTAEPPLAAKAQPPEPAFPTVEFPPQSQGTNGKQ